MPLLRRLRSRRLRPNTATGGGSMSTPINPHSQPVSQLNYHDRRVQQRLAQIRFHQPVIMNNAQNRAHINRAMQHLPALSTQPPDHPRGRSHRQRNHQHERGKSHRNEPPLLHILPHFRPGKKLVQANPRAEMQGAIKKREKPQHPPETNQLRLPQNLSQRKNRQSDDQKTQRPIPGRMGDEFNGIRPKIHVVWKARQAIVKRAPQQLPQWNQARQKHHRFGPFACKDGIHARFTLNNISSGPCRRTGWRPDRRSHWTSAWDAGGIHPGGARWLATSADDPRWDSHSNKNHIRSRSRYSRSLAAAPSRSESAPAT